MTTKRREYTREFKLEAVGLVVDHKRKIAEVAESLGIGTSTLENWVRKYKKEQQEITPTQGTHYTSKKFAESVVDCNGLIQGMSRRGNSLRAKLSVLYSGKAVLF